jgi:signal transduction histidine kinase
MKLSTLIQFSKLVADSPTSETVASLLAQTVVDKCGGFHALVFGTDDEGDFRVLSSYGGCTFELSRLDLTGVDTVAELRVAVLKICGEKGYSFRAFPMISDAGLFGALGVVYTESVAPMDEDWRLIEGLAELTAISLNKTYQHQRLQKAFDDLRASQDALVRTEKLRALGQMSAEINHDLKNLFNPIQLYTDQMRDCVDNRDEVLEILGRIDRVLRRGLETVERLSDFSRVTPEESDATPTDVNSLVREAVELSRPKLAASKLHLELDSPPTVVLRQADCVTAIVNLVFNAVDATQGKGKITIRTGASDSGAWIEVEDDGPGIPADLRKKILEPLFTTKGKHGTGLGIPIVEAFAHKHGGRLEIESEPGKGARFRMWFPAYERHAKD